VLRPFNHSGNIIINLKGSVSSILDFTVKKGAAYKQFMVSETERF
jgi:hypothetical protein